MATNLYPVNINLNKSELQNAVIQNLAYAPASPKAGQVYYDTTDNTYRGYNGAEWVDLSNQGEVYTFSTGLTETNGTVTLNQATGSDLGGVIVGTNISVSNGTISVANASTSAKGVIEIATDTEASAGTDTTRAVTPKQLAAKIDKLSTSPTAGTYTKVTINSDGLVSSGANLSASDIPNLTLSKITDVTATASELNVLDGITATTAELNYTDGVTSNIQTQLNNKVTKNANITSGTHTKISYDEKGLVTGGSDLTATDIPDLSSAYISVTQKGIANGVASLGSDGKVPSGQLPSFVDDVIDAYIVSGSTALSAGWLSATSGGSALTPETGKIYVVLTSGEYLNKTYRWSGTTYVEISSSPGQATESTAGIAKIATQAQVTAGTDDTTIVTPKKLATAISGGAFIETSTNPALTVSSGSVTWTVTTDLTNTIARMMITASGEEVYPHIIYGNGSIAISWNTSANVTAGTYTVVITGTK